MVAHLIDHRNIAWVLGSFLASLVGCMLVPYGYALFSGQPEQTAFLQAGLVTAAAAGFLLLFGRRRERRDLQHREGILLVSLIWVCMCLFGALPVYFSGSFAHFTDAALDSIRELGVTHIWYTGVPHHAVVRDYSDIGISNDDPRHKGTVISFSNSSGR